jgi:hypothetical protein
MSNNSFYSNLQQRLEQAARAGLSQTGLLANPNTNTESAAGIEHSEQERAATQLEPTPENMERLRNIELRFYG